MKKIILNLAILFTAAGLFANNLRITGGTQISENQVTFAVSWDNSWRVLGAPANHDAVWIFIKYRDCGSGPYKHALISTTMANHQFDPRVEAATPVSLNDRFGNLPSGATETNGLGNNLGIMLRRSDVGKGDIGSAICTLKIVTDTGEPFPTGGNYEIKVIGIEMVYVPTEEYILGDGLSASAFIPTTVSSENAITANSILAVQTTLPAEYPKGYGDFYCMKYEITQGQFYKFMITGVNLGTSPADYTGINRNTLSLTGATAPDRAQNYMTWGDLTAYLDWAALRPITELEYEKACRGSGLFPNYSYAWGTSSYQRVLYISGTEDGTETSSTTNANAHCYERFPTGFYPGGATYYPPAYHSEASLGSGRRYFFSAISAPLCEAVNPIYPGFSTNNTRYYMYAPVLMCGSAVSQGYGPIGAGLFARDATLDRATTGGTYFGIMEMSGNVAEQCVDVKSTTYTGVWGNGYLNFGKADVTDWPAATAARALRGGGYALPATNMRVCDRTYNNNTSNANGPIADAWRKGTVGGRGGR